MQYLDETVYAVLLNESKFYRQNLSESVAEQYSLFSTMKFWKTPDRSFSQRT